ncbi:MAG: hypothetical protein ACFE9Z_16545 [Promethearchaeota archaeon]
MRSKYTVIIWFGIASLISLALILGFSRNLQDQTPSPLSPSTQSIIIDHNCVKLDEIPIKWIETTRNSTKVHYAHTSHGGQIITGLTRLESSNSNYSIAIAGSSLPTEVGTLCIFDGQESASYITPDLYWESASGIQDTYDVVNHNPTITISIWCWCCQVSYYSTSAIQTYLNQMNAFEQHYLNQGRNVTFVYMTGNCDEGDYPEGTTAEGDRDPSAGYHRYLNNKLIRQYCIENNKTLFDFADIECWLYDDNGNPYDHSTYQYDNGTDIITVPKRQWAYSNVSQAAHTSYENCENKGKAFWWMLARLAGWIGS